MAQCEGRGPSAILERWTCGSLSRRNGPPEIWDLAMGPLGNPEFRKLVPNRGPRYMSARTRALPVAAPRESERRPRADGVIGRR